MLAISEIHGPLNNSGESHQHVAFTHLKGFKKTVSYFISFYVAGTRSVILLGGRDEIQRLRDGAFVRMRQMPLQGWLMALSSSYLDSLMVEARMPHSSLLTPVFTQHIMEK